MLKVTRRTTFPLPPLQPPTPSLQIIAAIPHSCDNNRLKFSNYYVKQPRQHLTMRRRLEETQAVEAAILMTGVPWNSLLRQSLSHMSPSVQQYLERCSRAERLAGKSSAASYLSRDKSIGFLLLTKQLQGDFNWRKWDQLYVAHWTFRYLSRQTYSSLT